MMNELTYVRYHCTNELCHFEWQRFSTEEQTADVTCPTCQYPLVMEER